MSWNCLVVDDEQLARKLIEGYLNRIPHLELAASCKGPLQAMDVLRQQKIDLMFLDIQMPDLLGTEFLRGLTQRPPAIFTTAYKEYALEGYDLDVVDYLLKPISFPRFLQAVNKVSFAKEQKEPQLQSLDFVVVKADHKVYRLRHEDILYIEGEREYVRYHCREQRVMALESLKNLEATLPDELFMRVHRSFIVNKSKVQALYGNQLEIGGKTIPIGRSYKDAVVASIFA